MQYELECRGICKRYNTVIANDHIDLKVKKGEVHAIVGENGAGKSTLMSILYGIVQPDSGEIFYQGKRIVLNSPRDAIKAGIGMVHQHFMLVPEMTVAENIALGKPPFGKMHWNPKDLERAVAPILEETKMHLDFQEKIIDVSVGQRQRIEIIKTLYRGAETIILDEPTATLTPVETTELFNIIRALTKNGHTIIFITHKLEEVMAISDRITALRMGKLSGTADTKDVTSSDIAHMMIGRDLRGIKKVPHAVGEPALEIEHITVKQNSKIDAVKDFSLSLRKGEIVGIAGVEGNGQAELVDAIVGTRTITKGKISVFSEDISHLNTAQRIHKGIGFIPPDRMVEGLAPEMQVFENLIFGVHREKPIAKNGFINWNTAKAHSRQLIDKFNIKTPSETERAKNLSGGNLQKIVVARELGRDPKLVVASQPTRGIDIGSSEQIRNELGKIRDNGGAVLLISADLEEILEMSDRIIVMYEGRNVGEISGAEATREKLGRLMFGIKEG